MRNPIDRSDPGPDGFQHDGTERLRAAHLFIDRVLTAAQGGGDPHHCRVERLKTYAELGLLDDTTIIELIDASLLRIWRIEGLGPRALDEGGVRGWNSIGWLTNFLRTLLRRSVRPTEINAVSTLLTRLNAKGSSIHTSLGVCLPDLAEWTEAATVYLSLDDVTRNTLNELAARFESKPTRRSVWKKKQLRRAATAFRNAVTRAGSGGTGDAESGTAGSHLTEDSIELQVRDNTRFRDNKADCLWIDRRFQGERVLQHLLAQRLRDAGWTFRLQGSWDPPAPPSTLVNEGEAHITLVLGERDPSDLFPGGSCRWVTLEEIRISWKRPQRTPPDHPNADADTRPTVPTTIVDLLNTTNQIVSASISPATRPDSNPSSPRLPDSSS